MHSTPHISGRKLVVLGVTGGIAAYKACEVVRALVRDGIRVKVVMTEAATRFVGPLTFRTLSDEPVTTSLWDDPATAPVHHISLAEEADVLAIVPCTANVIAKLAHGRADDMLTTTALATEAPLVIAPAMNTHMWRAPVTRDNLAVLRERGVTFVEPATGDLACGDTGEGRLADVDDILSAIHAELNRSCDLEGLSILVTAGPTYEPLDPVRFLGNMSSGRTGYAIAEEAARRGAGVTLVSGPTSLPDPFGVATVRVNTAVHMRDAVLAEYASCDVVIASAAVSDFRPADPVSGKLRKDEVPSEVALARNPDILAELGAAKGDRILVGFAAETGDPLPGARSKLEAKSLDLVVANDVSDPTIGFATAANRVWFVSPDGAVELPIMHKREIARLLMDDIARLSGRS